VFRFDPYLELFDDVSEAAGDGTAPQATEFESAPEAE
jgi:hypothetical protein